MMRHNASSLPCLFCFTEANNSLKASHNRQFEDERHSIEAAGRMCCPAKTKKDLKLSCHKYAVGVFDIIGKGFAICEAETGV